MKLTIEPVESAATQLRYVRCVAIIPKSKKNGVPRSYQKTWKVRTVAPNFASDEMRFSFEQNAKRWEAKVMDKIKREREFSEAVAADRVRLELTPHSPENTGATSPSSPASESTRP